MSESKCVLDSSVNITHYGESRTSTKHGALEQMLESRTRKAAHQIPPLSSIFQKAGEKKNIS